MNLKGRFVWSGFFVCGRCLYRDGMIRTSIFIALSLTLAPLSAQAQLFGRSSPPAKEEAPPQPSAEAAADRATQTVRCQTEANPDLAISGCSALIQSGLLSDAALGAIFQRRATLYAQQQNYEKALSDINLVLQLMRPDAALYALKGRVTQALDLRADAIASYQECLARDASNADCKTNLDLMAANAKQENDACNASGEPDAVIAACNLLIQRSPTVARYYNARGVAYFAKKDFRNALENFSDAIRLSPQDTVMLTNRCNAYIQVRQFDRAIDDCDDALRAKRDNGAALYARGLAKFAKDDAEGALADLNAAMDRNPAQPALVLAYRGAAYLKKGDLTTAEKDLAEALKQSPDSAAAHTYMGGLYVERQQPDKALVELNTALTLNPVLTAARIYRGRAYIQKKEQKRGLEDLDAAVRLEPDNALVFQARGQAYVSLGQTEKAAADFRACKLLDPFAQCAGVTKPAANEKPASQTASKPPAKTVTAPKPAPKTATKPAAKPQAKAAAPAAKPTAQPKKR
jgi:tetratricopeptide (TPR) repeat protein